MSASLSREQARDLLLGRTPALPPGFDHLPPYQRARAARRAAVGCLAEQSRPTSLELGALLHALTRDGDARVRLLALSALLHLLAPALAAPVLVACTVDADEAVREAAAAALARLPSEEAQLVVLPRGEPLTRSAKVPGFIGH